MQIKLQTILPFVLFAATGAFGDEKLLQPGPLNRYLAQVPKEVTVSIGATDTVMDGGSVLNDIHFSDGHVYRLILHTPIEIGTHVVHHEIYFTISIRGDWQHREALEHNSAAERRLIELLKSLAKASNDPHQTKNSTSLVKFLSNRDQPFPRPHGGDWDLTPW